MKFTFMATGLRVVILLAGLLLSACNQSNASPPEASQHVTTHALPVGTVSRETTTEYMFLAGSVISDSRIEITSRITGYIKQLAVKEGDRVAAGQLLVELDSSDVDDAVVGAGTAVAKARAALKDNEFDMKSFEKLYRQGTVSETQYRKIRLQRDVAIEELQRAKSAQATAKAQRKYVQITSPVEGIVVARPKRAGDLAIPGTSLLTVESSRGLLFQTYVPEGLVTRLELGAQVEVKIDVLNRTLLGTITRIVFSGDPVTRRFEIKVALPETEHMLAGMFGRARMTKGTREVIRINKESLLEIGGLTGVLIVDENNRARFRWLYLGQQWAKQVEVLGGLKPGERYLLSEAGKVRVGDLIEPLK